MSEIRCAKAVFDAADHYVKCGVDSRILDERCKICVQYVHTDEGIPVINRRIKNE